MTKSASFIEAALDANRANFILKTSGWAKADPLFSVVQLDGATAVFSGSSTDTFNILALDRITKRPVFDIIEEARSTLFGDNRFAVWSWQDGQLQSLPVDKTAIEENLIMTGDSDSLTAIPEGREMLSVTPVQEPMHMMDAGTVLASTFGESEEAFMIQSVFAGQDQTSIEQLPVQYLLAYGGGKAVASASYILDGNHAGIYDIAVLPSEQKQGLGTRMFDTLIGVAVAKGARSFTLQASADGAGLYDRAGFQTLGACWCLDIS